MPIGKRTGHLRELSSEFRQRLSGSETPFERSGHTTRVGQIEVSKTVGI